MVVYGIGDLHLSSRKPKPMDIFGPAWENHQSKIEENWRRVVGAEDIVLIPGDISWAMHYEDALADLQFLAGLPGSKVLIKGNHDYWWPGISKLRHDAPAELYFIQNDVLTLGNVAVTGTRLWDFPFVQWNGFVENQGLGGPEREDLPPKKGPEADDERIRHRELERLRLCLSQMPESSDYHRIVMVHFPPVGSTLEANPITTLLAEHHVETCLFGHLHNLRPEAEIGGAVDGVNYLCVSADYLAFAPKPVLAA